MSPVRAATALGLVVPAMAALVLATEAQALSLPGQLNAVDVRTRVVGHSVVNADRSTAWWYAADGTFGGEAGHAVAGRFTVRDDGQLCWKESDGTTGCFVFIADGRQLLLRRVDPGHEADLGPVTLGKGK